MKKKALAIVNRLCTLACMTNSPATPKKHTRESIVALLLSNDRAVERAIVAIHNHQTAGEKMEGRTNERNGVGFNGSHAPKGSYYAEWLRSGRSLSGKHLDGARKMAIFYVAQLVRIANSR